MFEAKSSVFMWYDCSFCQHHVSTREDMLRLNNKFVFKTIFVKQVSHQTVQQFFFIGKSKTQVGGLADEK